MACEKKLPLHKCYLNHECKLIPVVFSLKLQSQSKSINFKVCTHERFKADPSKKAEKEG